MKPVSSCMLECNDAQTGMRTSHLESSFNLLPQEILRLVHPLKPLLLNQLEFFANGLLPGFLVLGCVFEGEVAGAVFVDSTVPSEEVDGPGGHVGQHVRGSDLDHAFLELGGRHGDSVVRV